MKKLEYIFTVIIFIGLTGASAESVLVKFGKPRNLDKSTQIYGRTGVLAVDQVLEQLQAEAVPLFHHSDSHLDRWFCVSVPRDSLLEQALRSLSEISDLVYVGKNRVFRLHSDPIPNDTRISEQWALQKIGAFQAWAIDSGNADVPVAVIDTGVDYDHPDLQPNIWINPGEDLNGNAAFDSSDLNGIDDDANGFIDDIQGWDFTDAPNYPDGGDYLNRDNDPNDEYGHGTGVAGIVSAVSNNRTGISGLAPHCRIMNLRAFTGNGYGEEDDVASAVLYAVENGARIINMSFGDVFVSRVLDDIIEYGRQQQIIMVASAGNSSTREIHYPSGFNSTISVGSTNENDQLSGFSNYGSTIDLVAPGSNILSTTINNDYRYWNGTSFSAPHVSAAAALLLSQEPELSAESVRGILVNSTDLI